MNQETNRIWNIRDFCERQLGIPAVVLYPGDQWEAGEHHDSSNAIAQYREDLSDVLKGRRPVIASEAVSWDRLERLADCFFRKARERNSPFVIRNLHGATAYLSDLNILARISFASGLERLSGVRDEADIVLSSDSLGYSLMFDWGGDALAINGRYEVPPEGKPQRFFRHFRVASLNSSGDRVDLPLIVRKAVNRFRT